MVGLSIASYGGRNTCSISELESRLGRKTRLFWKQGKKNRGEGSARDSVDIGFISQGEASGSHALEQVLHTAERSHSTRKTCACLGGIVTASTGGGEDLFLVIIT